VNAAEPLLTSYDDYRRGRQRIQACDHGIAVLDVIGEGHKPNGEVVPGMRQHDDKE